MPGFSAKSGFRELRRSRLALLAAVVFVLVAFAMLLTRGALVESVAVQRARNELQRVRNELLQLEQRDDKRTKEAGGTEKLARLSAVNSLLRQRVEHLEKQNLALKASLPQAGRPEILPDGCVMDLGQMVCENPPKVLRYTGSCSTLHWQLLYELRFTGSCFTLHYQLLYTSLAAALRFTGTCFTLH